MRGLVICGTFGSLLLVSAAWSQSTPSNGTSSVAGTNNIGASRGLSPGEQSLANALAGSEVTVNSRKPMSLDQIAASKESGQGFGVIFQQMRADGDTNAKNFGSVVSDFRHDRNAERGEWRSDASLSPDRDGARWSDDDGVRHFDHDDTSIHHQDGVRSSDQDGMLHGTGGAGAEPSAISNAQSNTGKSNRQTVVPAGHAATTTALGNSAGASGDLVTGLNGNPTARRGGSHSAARPAAQATAITTGLGTVSGGSHSFVTAGNSSSTSARGFSHAAGAPSVQHTAITTGLSHAGMGWHRL